MATLALLLVLTLPSSVSLKLSAERAERVGPQSFVREHRVSQFQRNSLLAVLRHAQWPGTPGAARADSARTAAGAGGGCRRRRRTACGSDRRRPAPAARRRGQPGARHAAHAAGRVQPGARPVCRQLVSLHLHEEALWLTPAAPLMSSCLFLLHIIVVAQSAVAFCLCIARVRMLDGTLDKAGLGPPAGGGGARGGAATGGAVVRG